MGLATQAAVGRVEFWFDVGSPYSYLAWCALPSIAASAGAVIDWRPMLLGGVFKAVGNRSPAEIPAKSRWMRGDLQQWAHRLGVPFRHNPFFPVNTLTLMRGATGYLLRGGDRRGGDSFEAYLRAVFTAMWVDERNLADPAVVAEVLAGAGLDAREFEAITSDPAVKDALKRNTEQAVERGVFGAPTFFVGEQMFWGHDRLPLVADALGGRAGGGAGDGPEPDGPDHHADGGPAGAAAHG